jgi:hypothetical protein
VKLTADCNRSFGILVYDYIHWFCGLLKIIPFTPDLLKTHLTSFLTESLSMKNLHLTHLELPIFGLSSPSYSDMNGHGVIQITLCCVS